MESSWRSTSIDWIVRLWDLETWACVKTIRGHGATVSCVCFSRSPDGKQLASGGRDDEVRVWDADTGECVKKFSCDEHCEMRRKYWNPDESEPGVISVCFAPDGSQVFAGSTDKLVRRFRL